MKFIIKYFFKNNPSKIYSGLETTNEQSANDIVEQANKSDDGIHHYVEKT